MKIVRKIINFISILIIAIAVIILLNVVLTKKGEAPNILGYSVFRVMTGSMEPTIETDSLIVTKRVDVKELKENDIISYYSSDPALNGAVNTHRITGIEEAGGKCIFTTKGDANNANDIYKVTEESIVGKLVFQSHGLGVFVHLLSNPLIFIPIIVIPFIVLLISNIVKTVKLTKEIAEEEDRKTKEEIMELLKKKSDSNSKEEED